jgi:hypothetical protein
MSQNEFSANVRTGPVISASQSDIPQSFMSSNAPRPMAGRIAQKLAIASTASQGASGTVLVPLGCGAGQGFIKSGSAYLRFNVVVSDMTNSVYNFNITGDAQAVIQRVTLYLNGQIAEQINNYNRIQGALDTHGLNIGYADNDLAVLSAKGAGTTYNVTASVTIPLKLGLLNAQQDLPLFLFNTAQLEFNLESLFNAINVPSGATVSPTSYTVSNVQLIYSVFYPEQEYEMSMRQVLASGRLFQIPIKTWYNLQVSNAGGTLKSVPIGLNMSSVLGVFHFVNNIAASVKNPVVYTGDTPANQGLRVFLDGNLVNSYSIQDTATIFAEMKKSLNLFADPDRSSYSIAQSDDGSYFNPAVLTSAKFLTTSFFGALSLARTFESGLAMIGTAVGQMIVEVDNAGTAGTLNICTAYEQILTVDAMGSISLIR